MKFLSNLIHHLAKNMRKNLGQVPYNLDLMNRIVIKIMDLGMKIIPIKILQNNNQTCKSRPIELLPNHKNLWIC